MKLRLVTQNGNSLIITVPDMMTFQHEMRRTGVGQHSWLGFTEGMIRPAELDVVEVLPGYGALPGPGYEEVPE